MHLQLINGLLVASQTSRLLDNKDRSCLVNTSSQRIIQKSKILHKWVILQFISFSIQKVSCLQLDSVFSSQKLHNADKTLTLSG